jgi:hypothetical protein
VEIDDDPQQVALGVRNGRRCRVAYVFRIHVFARFTDSILSFDIPPGGVPHREPDDPAPGGGEPVLAETLTYI